MAMEGVMSDQHQEEGQKEKQVPVFKFGDAVVTAPSEQELNQLTGGRGLVSGGSSVTAASAQASSGLYGSNVNPLAVQLHNFQLGQNQLQQSLQHQAALLAQQQSPLAPVSVTHNLIPIHLQPYSATGSLNGTLGHPSALIPSLVQPTTTATIPANNAASLAALSTLTTMPMLDADGNNAATVAALAHAARVPPPVVGLTPSLAMPVYNGVNPSYPGLRVVYSSPPIFAVDNFLTPDECNFLINHAQDCFGPAPVVGKGAGEVSPSRTSSTCYLAREDLPDLMRKVTLLTGKPMEHCELPQVGRYYPSQQYLQHYDAFDPSNEDGRRFAANGGQRTITVLIYLNDVPRGGATRFPALGNLEIQPRQGMALVFFPATVDGMLDKLALHAAMPAVDTKYVSQVWIRQSNYNGQPSKRLSQTLGVPFGHGQQPGVSLMNQHMPFGTISLQQ